MRYLPELFSEDTRYAFAVGKIKVMETRLFSKSDLQRMLEAPSFNEAFSMLMDSPYEPFMASLESPLEFEQALGEELENTYRTIDSLSHDKGLTDIFRIRWDFHNLKVLLKASHLEGGSDEQSLVPHGLIDIDLMRDSIEEGDFNRLPDHLRVAAEEAAAEYEESNDPQMIDIVVERHSMQHLLRRAEEYPNRFLAGYYKAFIDLNNIRCLIRLKAMNGSARLLDKLLVEGGEIPKKRYFQMLDESAIEVSGLLRGTPYSEIVSQGVQDFAETGTLTSFEKLIDNYLIDYIKPAKYVAFGVEPLIAYLIAKEHEIKLIRIIMIGKINQLSTDAISSRLREPYV